MSEQILGSEPMPPRRATGARTEPAEDPSIDRTPEGSPKPPLPRESVRWLSFMRSTSSVYAR